MRLFLTLVILCSRLIAVEINPVVHKPTPVLQRYELKQDDLYVYNSIQQISSAFNLPKDEFVVIKPLYDNVLPELVEFKTLIKKGFGIEIVFVSFGKEGLMKTNKGRDFNSKYLGYRVDSGGFERTKKSNAILIQGDQTKQGILKTVAHEMTHVMQDNEPQLYKILQGVNELVDKEFKSNLYNLLNMNANNSNMKLSSNDLENELTSYIVEFCASEPRSFWVPILETIEEVPIGTIEREKLNSEAETIIKIFCVWADNYKKKSRLK